MKALLVNLRRNFQYVLVGLAMIGNGTTLFVDRNYFYWPPQYSDLMNDQRIDMLMCLTGIALVILAMRNFHKIKHSEMLTGLLLGLSAFLVMSMIIVEITHTVGAGEFRMSKTAVDDIILLIGIIYVRRTGRR